MGRHRRDVELLTLGAAVERFYVLHDVLERPPAGVELAGGKRIEHECIIGVGTMAERQLSGCHRSGLSKQTSGGSRSGIGVALSA